MPKYAGIRNEGGVGRVQVLAGRNLVSGRSG